MIFGGLCYDWSMILLKIQNVIIGVQIGDYEYMEGMWNGYFGLIYKFCFDVNVYFIYVMVQDVNGGEFDVGISGGYGGLIIYNGEVVGVKFELIENFEVGIKWNVFGGKLLVMVVVFQIIKKDVMEGVNYVVVGIFNIGKNCVKGIEFGLSGNLISKLSVQVGVIFMKVEVFEFFMLVNVGKILSNFVDMMVVVQLCYQVILIFGFGIVVKYESKKYVG